MEAKSRQTVKRRAVTAERIQTLFTEIARSITSSLEIKKIRFYRNLREVSFRIELFDASPGPASRRKDR